MSIETNVAASDRSNFIDFVKGFAFERTNPNTQDRIDRVVGFIQNLILQTMDPRYGFSEAETQVIYAHIYAMVMRVVNLLAQSSGAELSANYELAFDFSQLGSDKGKFTVLSGMNMPHSKMRQGVVKNSEMGFLGRVSIRSTFVTDEKQGLTTEMITTQMDDHLLKESTQVSISKNLGPSGHVRYTPTYFKNFKA